MRRHLHRVALAVLLVPLGACSHTEGSECALAYEYQGRTYSGTAAEVRVGDDDRLPGTARPTCDGLDPVAVHAIPGIATDEAVAVGGVEQATVVVAVDSAAVLRLLENHQAPAPAR